MTAFLTLIESEQDKSRFCLLYEKYIAMVIAICRAKLKDNQSLAEECAQETFLYLAKNFSKVGDISSPQMKAFVGVVASTYAIKCFHREIEKSSRIELSFKEKEINTEVFDRFSSVELKCAVDSLDEELRNLIYLKYFFGLTNKEISQLTGDSEYKVRSKLARALAAVKKNLKED